MPEPLHLSDEDLVIWRDLDRRHRKSLLSPSPDNPDEWGSHKGVLRELASLANVKRVVEFGSGKYSTKLLLNLDIEQLISFEVDADWYERLLRGTDYLETEKWVPVYTPSLDVQLELIPWIARTAQMVFVDTHTAHRVFLMRELMRHSAALLIAHDWNIGYYETLVIPKQYSLSVFAHHVTSRQTAVLHLEPLPTSLKPDDNLLIMSSTS